MILAIGYLDYITGPYFYFATLYLVPITLAAWLAGRATGLAAAILSSATALAGMEGLASFFALSWNFLSLFFSFAIYVYILSRLKIALEEKKELVTRDQLTQISNRRHFFEVTSREINRSQRYEHPLTVVYIDIDNLKSVNDMFSQKKGDALLGLVGRVLDGSIRKIDVAARLGDDEFAVLFPETDYEGARIAIRRLQNNLRIAADKNKTPITFSIGAVTCEKPSCTFESLITMADITMYSAKKSGRNAVKHEIFTGTV